MTNVKKKILNPITEIRKEMKNLGCNMQAIRFFVKLTLENLNL